MICPECKRGLVEQVTLNAEQVPEAVEWIACPACLGTGVYHKSYDHGFKRQAASRVSDQTNSAGDRTLVTSG